MTNLKFNFYSYFGVKKNCSYLKSLLKKTFVIYIIYKASCLH